MPLPVVLAGMLQPTSAHDGLLEHVRGLHPRAKRALHYLVRPAGPPDEVFHEAVSSCLLEWATERRTVPHTVRIVGESWSGRAYELREVFERCAIPRAFCLADSDEGRGLLAAAGPGAKLPLPFTATTLSADRALLHSNTAVPRQGGIC